MGVRAIVFFSRGDRDGKTVFLRRQRTCGVRRDRAWRTISAVEVQHHFSIRYWISIQKSAARVSVGFASQVADHETETFSRFAAKSAQSQILAIQLKMNFPNDRSWRHVAQNVRNIH